MLASVLCFAKFKIRERKCHWESVVGDRRPAVGVGGGASNLFGGTFSCAFITIILTVMLRFLSHLRGLWLWAAVTVCNKQSAVLNAWSCTPASPFRVDSRDNVEKPEPTVSSLRGAGGREFVEADWGKCGMEILF